jgi:uncharacterized protein YaiI (UPF0178 family)
VGQYQGKPNGARDGKGVPSLRAHYPDRRHVPYNIGMADPAPAARLPVKLHRRVCLVITEDAVLAEELLARKKLAQEVAGRLSDRALLVRSGRLDAVLDELRRMGHTPQVVGRT